MEVTIIKHGEQVFAKTKEGELLKVNGIVIPHDGKPTSFYDSDTSFYKAVCADNTKHRAEYVSAGMVNIYPNDEVIRVPITD